MLEYSVPIIGLELLREVRLLLSYVFKLLYVAAQLHL